MPACGKRPVHQVGHATPIFLTVVRVTLADMAAVETREVRWKSSSHRLHSTKGLALATQFIGVFMTIGVNKYVH
jgi:hypothetical protein